MGVYQNRSSSGHYTNSPAQSANASSVLPLSCLSFGSAIVAAATMSVAVAKFDGEVPVLPSKLHERAQSVIKAPIIRTMNGHTLATISLISGSLSVSLGLLALHCRRHSS